MNNVVHASTGYSPFFLNVGQHPKTPLTPLTAPRTAGAKAPAAQQFYGGFSESLARAKASLHRAQCRQKEYADKKRKELILVPGQQVLLSTKNIRMAKPQGAV